MPGGLGEVDAGDLCHWLAALLATAAATLTYQELAGVLGDPERDVDTLAALVAATGSSTPVAAFTAVFQNST